MCVWCPCVFVRIQPGECGTWGFLCGFFCVHCGFGGSFLCDTGCRSFCVFLRYVCISVSVHVCVPEVTMAMAGNGSGHISLGPCVSFSICAWMYVSILGRHMGMSLWIHEDPHIHVYMCTCEYDHMCKHGRGCMCVSMGVCI